ncbi:MAG TPA: hypothetical protein VGD59_14755 [Acidisarcina sp.]
MAGSRSGAAALLSLVVLGTACRKTDDSRLNFESGINGYNKAHPECIWPTAKKFPIQAATSDDAKTEGLDALTDAGLLTRTTAEKRVFIIGSKQVNNYDVSSQGRSVWTQDPTQPGYGNFCYGSRDVTSIDTYSTDTNSSGLKMAQVNYHYKIDSVPGWANSAEIKTAFPELSTALSGPGSDTARLVMNGQDWQMNR